MDKMMALQFEGQKIAVPSSLPSNLQGDFKTSGQAIIQLAINSLFLLIIVTSLIFILLAGIRMIISRGDVGVLKTAKKQMLYAIVGLIVGTLAFFLVRTIITILGGDPTKYSL